MPKRLLAIFAGFCAAFVVVGLVSADRGLAQSPQQAPSPALPTDAQLDALLAAHNWGALGAALNASRSPQWGIHRMDWLHSRINAGGGSLLDFLYIRDLWDVGSAMNVADPNKDLRLTAGMIWLYTYEVVAIDGAMCEDRSAPAHRVDQLITMSPDNAVLAYLKAEPAELKTKIVDIAIALEKRTAPLRKNDDLLCRDGMEEMQAGIAAGTTHEVQTPPGGYGKTVAVETPPGYTPKILPPETYTLQQQQARATMRAGLLKLIS